MTDPGLAHSCQGLSPRVRGNLNKLNALSLCPRPIPACAGQPVISGDCDPSQGAYPRVCGATTIPPDPWATVLGLSPRVRGNRRSPRPSPAGSGPIPACAGQPSSHPGSRAQWGAYPRVCGATAPGRPAFSELQGLSPRVRGNRALGEARAVALGPIPACAGQPNSQRTVQIKAGAYPRVCGATPPVEALRLLLRGLSPRVRGNRVNTKIRPGGKRPIPACAGQPCIKRRPHESSWAYPRVCGATALKSICLAISMGLSPRVRGNLLYLTH